MHYETHTIPTFVYTDIRLHHDETVQTGIIYTHAVNRSYLQMIPNLLCIVKPHYNEFSVSIKLNRNDTMKEHTYEDL